jgi:hypothetical protein
MVGMLVQEKLDEKNKLMELAILDSLSTVSLDIRTHEVMNDEMIINSAFLIHKNKREKFEQLIDQLDTTHDGMLNFKLVGPLPCYSFYTLEVVDLNAESVEKARLDLELPHAISEVDIKKAYIAKSKIFHPDTQIENSDGKKFNNIQKAYQTLRDYVAAFRQSSSEVVLSLEKNHVAQNLTLVKIKD